MRKPSLSSRRRRSSTNSRVVRVGERSAPKKSANIADRAAVLRNVTLLYISVVTSETAILSQAARMPDLAPELFLASACRKPLHSGMKLISLAALALLLAIVPLPANPRHSQSNAKITKNEAEHIALKRFPGARVTAAKLETVDGKLVWSLQLVKGEAKARHVEVDAMSGRISAAGKGQP